MSAPPELDLPHHPPADPPPADPPRAGSTAAGPGARDDRDLARRQWQARWQRARWPLGVAAVVLVAALAGLLLVRPSTGGYLSPRSYAPDGARALVRVLSDQGTSVLQRDRFDDVAADLRADDGDDGAGGAVTVVVARTDLLVGQRARDLRVALREAGADLVLVDPGPALLADLGLLVATVPAEKEPALREPGCSDAVAARAGSALTGGSAFVRRPGTDQDFVGCYAVDQAWGYVSLRGEGGGRVRLLGSGAPLTNELLASAGDAALAVGTLGTASSVVWWTPSALDTGVAVPPALSDLLPRGLPWAAAQAAIAVLVAVLWRARRLGRLVTEPLPVVVRSVETTLGRGRLYRRAHARGRAAQVLRAATVRRLAERCALPGTAGPSVVAQAAAARSGRPVPDVTALLIGADPADDTALVILARALDSLENEVRRP